MMAARDGFLDVERLLLGNGADANQANQVLRSDVKRLRPLALLCESRDGKAMGWAEKLEGKADAKEKGQPPMMTFFLSRILSEHDAYLVCFWIHKRTKHPSQVFTLSYILTTLKGVASMRLKTHRCVAFLPCLPC